ncbi:hypothetical protein F5Y16DRAFT_296045 [Xylariaceae sp. FL0255]|nr:hypothetical protein F5Y16DRAFT_296045 [Xylariaceae sp. FL0255]
MRTQTLLYSLLATGTLGHVIRNPNPSASPKVIGKAVYILTNDKTNAIVALPINAKGTLSKGSVTPSGGSGSDSIHADTQMPAAPDALISQSALTLAGDNIFAVNAGSNTISMFELSPYDPTHLRQVGKPAALPGDFPNTVAASAKHSLVCAAMTGARNGISCASFSASNGIGTMDHLRSTGLNQTTPPMGPTNTVSHILINADESAFVTMVKGNPGTTQNGYISTLPIQSKKSCGGDGATSSVPAKDLRSTPNGTEVLFGTQNIPGGNNVFTTDASFGAVVLSLDPTTGAATTLGKGVIANQSATCWSAISSVTGSAFVTDVNIPRLVEMSTKDASIIKITDLSSGGDPGFIDLKAAGDFLYVLSPGNGTSTPAILVLDISGGQGTAKQIQRFSLEGIAGKLAQGMAILE